MSPRWIVGCVVALAVVAGSVPADAEPKPKPLDLSRIFDKLWVLEGSGGHHLILLPPWERTAVRKLKPKLAIDRPYAGIILFGTRGTYHRIYSSGYSRNGNKRFSITFWDHRSAVPKQGGAPNQIEFRDGAMSVRCGERRTRLTLVQGKRRNHILRTAKIYSRLWQREAVELARDHHATYYYVDGLTKAAGGSGFRLYRGKRGGLVNVPLVDVAQDSAGSSYVTRSGTLQLTRSGPGRIDASWIPKRGKPVRLTYLPVRRNLRRIYHDLGVYAGKPMGTPCDVY